MKEAFDFVSNFLDIKSVNTHYLFGSRRAMLIPGLEYLKQNKLQIRHLISSWWVGNRVFEFVDRIGLNISAHKLYKLAVKSGFKSANTKVKNSDYEKLETFFLLLEDDLMKLKIKEKRVLEKYLDQEGFLRSKSSAIVDIGWGGSMQTTLTDIYHNKNLGPVGGYYLGTNDRIKALRTRGIIAKGYIFEDISLELKQYLIWQSSEILEFICSAEHPSVLSFTRLKSKIVPVFSEINNDKFYIKSAKSLHNGLFDFFNDVLLKSELSDLKTLFTQTDKDRSFFTSFLYKTILNPKLEDIKKFCKIRHIPGLGETGRGRFIVRIPQYSLSLNLLKSFENAYWERGYMKTLDFPQKIVLTLFSKKYQERLVLYSRLKKTYLGKLFNLV
jgi:hypothetical protein